MMVTPDQIEQQSFTVRHIRGYDPGEVDDFLDEVVVSYRDTLTELQAARGEIARLRNAPTQQFAPVQQQSDPIGDVARLLAVAQQSVDQQAAEADRIVSARIAEAERDAAARVAEGSAKAEEIIAEGKSKRNEIIGELEVKRGDLQSKITKLLDSHNEITTKLRAALAAIEGEQ